MQNQPQEHNRQAWNNRVRQNAVFTRPAKNEEFDGDILGNLDPRGWLGGDVKGKRMLCLGAGGGRQGPLYAHLGAIVTVSDISDEQLKIDDKIAAERGLNLRTVCASMDDLSMMAEGSFDIVIQPVSTCYVPDISKVYQQVARVMVEGGTYVSQHKTPTSLQADVKPTRKGYPLVTPYYTNQPLPQVKGSKHREFGTKEFLHRWEQLVGGLCRSGFVVEDLAEPYHGKDGAEKGSFADRSNHIAPYVRILAKRKGRGGVPVSSIIVPD